MKFSGAYENMSTKGELGFFNKTKNGGMYNPYNFGSFLKTGRKTPALFYRIYCVKLHDLLKFTVKMAVS